MNTMRYDEANNIVWGEMEATVPQFGEIIGIIGLIPTQTGYIKAFCYTQEKEEDTFKPDCSSIIQSIRPSANVAYRSQWSDNLPSFMSGVSLAEVLKWIIIGAGVALVSYFIDRRKRKTED